MSERPELQSSDNSQISKMLRTNESIDFYNFENPEEMNTQNPQQNSLKDGEIWGTDIKVSSCMSQFKTFLTDFRASAEAELKYINMLEEVEETQIYIVQIDCHDLNAFNAGLYRQLISYPQEILPIFDKVLNDEYNLRFPDDLSESSIQVKVHNLVKTSRMRDIDPDDIDCLVSFRAMITRVSAVIPDLKLAFFRCSNCRHEHEVEVDRGRISHPRSCANSACQAKDSYVLVHNRCSFADKQMVRVQETPESIPEGETSQTVDVFCYSDLIDSARPGDRLEITGVYCAQPARVSQTKRNLKALYRGFINAIHFKKTLKHRFAAEGGEPFGPASESASCELSGSKEERREQLRKMAEDPEVYQKLVNSIAPSIWELEDIKKGLLCQLFGGAFKQRRNKSFFRSEINVLLCGDPGTSKSQLLQYVHKISARGIYTSGKGSSAVGLTASITRDPESRETVLESGALVLSDKGICCIDEFDKMSDSARSVLHEVMEQQTISVAKAGIVCSLNARASVLAAANPKESRYDAGLSVVENITLPPALLSRFDLIYIVLDKPNERLDRRLAKHLVSLYGLQRAEPRGDFMSAETLAAYVALAREEAKPRLTDEAADRLIKGYLELRKSGRFRNKRVIAATARQLESLVRISEALAKMRFSNEVVEGDADEALRLMRVATQSAATDPKTGIINMDLISVDSTAMERKETVQQMDLLLDIIDDFGEAKSFSFLLSSFNRKSEKKVSFTRFKDLIRQLEQKNDIRCKNWQAKDPLISRVDS